MKTEERFEQELKELFTEMVDHEPPLSAPVRIQGSSWTRRFSAWVGGSILGRGLATASLAGAVAVGAVVAPQVLDPPSEIEPGNGSLVQPGGDTDPTPTATPSALQGAQPDPATTRYRDAYAGYTLHYPSAWSKVGSGALGRGFVAFVSDASVSRGYEMWQQDGSCGPCPVAVPVQVVNFAEHSEWVRLSRNIADKWRRQGVKVTERRTTVAGRRTVAYHVRFPDRAAPERGDQEWCRGCEGDWFLVSWYHGTTLDLRVMALDHAAYERDGEAGLALVRSVRDTGPPSQRLMPKPPTVDPDPDPNEGPVPPGDPKPDCTPRANGSIPTAMTCDTATEAALRFAQRRIEGKNAEDWLSITAKHRYDIHEGGLWLYTPDGERPYSSYFLTERHETADGMIRFTLEMNQGYIGDTGDRIRTEHIFVAAGSGNWRDEPTMNSMVVKNATLISEPTEP